MLNWAAYNTDKWLWCQHPAYGRRRADISEMYSIMAGALQPDKLLKEATTNSIKGQNYKTLKPHAHEMIKQCLNIRAIWKTGLSDYICNVTTNTKFKMNLF